ncbi:outer dynein arm-docking complex subunit 1-like isoform X1 [Cebidichthys violaceus]|uniref:outer dynein arm-docking complex subunit 1-like isoform X1 n=1 Tax=Cebidichthys violaceus TaxID=271503 RepID=UPI0035C970F9
MNRRSFVARRHLLVDFSETDLIKLKLQHRRAEGAKRAHREETQGLLCRQKRDINRLQYEQEELLSRVPQSCFSRWTDASVVQDLTAMLACRDRIDEELEAEKGQVASLKDQILKLERRLAGQKTDGGTTHHSMSLIKNTRWTENKLYRGRKSLNTMMTRNGELREELQILQVEKKQFLQVQSHLEMELHEIRKNISNLRTKCTEAFNASVKNQERQRMLMDQNAKDVAHYIIERDNLFCCCNFEVFLGIKAIVRNNQDTDHRKVKHKQLESKKLARGEFEDAVKKILTETKEMDLNKLVRNFIQMEEQNYTLLKFVNYQHSEAEAIRRRISQLCNEREIFVAEEQRQKEQHHDLRMIVSVKQETTEQNLAAYQQCVEAIEKLLDRLKEGVESLLRISCDCSVTREQSGSSDGVQDENVVEYLRRAENRVNELLTLQSFIHFQENLNPWDIDSLRMIAGQLLGMSSPAVIVTTAAEIASHVLSDDPDVVESLLLEEKVPLSRDDLLILLKRRIQRKKKTERLI